MLKRVSGGRRASRLRAIFFYLSLRVYRPSCHRAVHRKIEMLFAILKHHLAILLLADHHVHPATTPATCYLLLVIHRTHSAIGRLLPFCHRYLLPSNIIHYALSMHFLLKHHCKWGPRCSCRSNPVCHIPSLPSLPPPPTALRSSHKVGMTCA